MTAKKIMAAVALGFAGVATFAMPASAHGPHHHDNPHSDSVINGDVVEINGDILSDIDVDSLVNIDNDDNGSPYPL